MTMFLHPRSRFPFIRAARIAALLLIGIASGPAIICAQDLPTLSGPTTPDPTTGRIVERPVSQSYTDAATRDAGPLTPARRVALDRREPGLHPYALYRFRDVDGLPNAPGTRFSTKVHEVSAGVFWRIGEHWIVDYSPTWTNYSNDALEDSVDHTLLVNWQTTYENWHFRADHRTRTSNTVLYETAEQTERDSFQTTFSAAVALSSQLGSETRLGHNVRLAEAFADFREYTIGQMFRLQPGERLAFSAGAIYGRTNVSEAPNQEHVTPRIEVDWLIGDKLSLRGGVGIEYRSIDDGKETNNPVYDASLNYTPLETTWLTFGYNRSVSPSLFQNAIVRREVFEASLTQRLLGRLFLTVSAGRRNDEYETRLPSALDGRRDRHEYYSARLSTVFLERGMLAIFYQPAGESESNRPNFDYDVRTLGVEFRYNF